MKKKSTSQSAYQKSGVDIKKADEFTGIISGLVKSTLNSKVFKSIGGYAGLYQISDTTYLAATTDGVGTKLKIAFETGIHHTIGIDLVAMSVNDLICVGAKPLFFLDYFATGKLDLKTATNVLKGIVKGCELGKVALIGGETAEMPDLYQKGEYDLAGFAVGIVEKADLLDGSRIRSGDILIGIESSGPHSNGYSLIRKCIPTTEKKLLKMIFEPTKIYVESIRMLKQKLGASLKGMAHITGSGFLNIPRIQNDFDYRIKIPETMDRNKIFQVLINRGKMNIEEAYETFNMGFGMVIAVDSAVAMLALKTLQQNGEKAHLLGVVERPKNKKSGNVYIQDGEHSIHLS